jgi:hypothetical protein
MIVNPGHQPPGVGLSRDLAPGEAVESYNDAFISRRHDQRVRDEGGRPEEEAWRESERHHEAARRAQNASAWHEYHLAAADRLRATLEALASHHEREAQKYLPKGAS